MLYEFRHNFKDLALKVSDFMVFLLTLFQRLNMSKQRKIILGILSFLPLLFIVIYFVFFFSMFASGFRESAQGGGPPVFLLNNMNGLSITMGLLVITSLGLLIYYIIHVMNNTRLDSSGRLVWLLIVLLANVVAYPIYWYLEVWKSPATAGGYQS
jgi:hypothetical protein